MNSATAVDPIPQKISPHDLYLWPNNPRYIPLEERVDLFDVSNVKDLKVQRAYIRRVKSSGDGSARAFRLSIEFNGLMANPMTPISVCSLVGGGYVVIDGNARVMAIKDLLADKAWCAANSNYAESLRSGILVMDFGSFADRDVQIAALAQATRANWGEDDDEDDEKTCLSCDLPWSGRGFCDSCATPPGWHP